MNKVNKYDIEYEIFLTPDKKDKTGYEVFKNVKQWLQQEVSK